MDCNKMYSSKPTVDENAEYCSEITGTDCITIPFDNLYLKLFEGDPLTEVLIKLIEKVQTLENQLKDV